MATSDDMRTQQIRRARGKFIAMAVTYSLGVFNDNFFKQAAVMIAIAAGLSELQGYATVIFSLPFILVAAPAGWLADRYPKRSVVIGCKALEAAAMVCGALGVLYESWAMMLTMVGMMGIHSTMFSPALNGSIPELYPKDYVLKANSILKSVTTTAMLLGIILAGLALARKEAGPGGFVLGRVVVAAAVVAVAACGLAVSLGVPRREAAAPGRKFPWTGPADTMKFLAAIRSDRLLFWMVWADAFVWFMAVLIVQTINKMGMAQFALGESTTSYMAVAELAGVAVGGLLCGRLATGGRWFRVLAPAAMALAASSFLLTLVPLVPVEAQWGSLSVRMAAIYALLVWTGMAGGVLLVPLESFLQARPSADRKGQTIAAANFAAFSAMLLAGLAFVVLNYAMTPTSSFGVIGALAAAFGAALWWGSPKGDTA